MAGYPDAMNSDCGLSAKIIAKMWGRLRQQLTALFFVGQLLGAKMTYYAPVGVVLGG
jgi:hypothetical protein